MTEQQAPDEAIVENEEVKIQETTGQDQDKNQAEDQGDTQEVIQSEGETQQSTEEKQIPEIDFNDIGAQFQQKPPELSEQDVLEQMLEKAIEKKLKLPEDNTKAEDDSEDIGIVTKKDLLKIKEEAKEELRSEIQKEHQMQQVMAQAVQESNSVAKQYSKKLEKVLVDNGYDLNLKASADILWNQMAMQKAIQLNRSPHNPILNGEETLGLVREHYDRFSKMFLSSGVNLHPPANTQSLSPAGQAAGVAEPAGKNTPGELDNLNQKARDRKLSPIEALKLYNHKS